MGQFTPRKIPWYPLNIHQNSFHMLSYSSEILIIWHLRSAVPRPEVTALYQTRASSWNRQFSGTCPKMPPGVSVPQLMVFPHPFSPTLLTSSAVRTPENTDEGSVDAEPADDVAVQMEYISD